MSIHVPYAEYELISVRTLLGAIFRTANAIENAAENLRNHWGELPAHLSGSPVATTGYYAAMTVRTRDADDLAQMLRSMWKALDTYADDAETPLTNLARLREEAAQWQSRRPKDVAAPPGTAVEDLWAMQAGYAPGTVCMAQSPWVTWENDKARIEADVAHWASEYERIADVCAAALRRVNDPTLMSWWEQIRASIASRGFNDFALTGEQLMIYQAVTLGDKLIAGELDEAGMARLDELLTILADNPEAAATFWTTVGGARTNEMFTELGRNQVLGAIDASTHRLAQAMRESLASASGTWSPPQARDFVEDLLPGPNEESLQVIGYLFNDTDNARMSATFTVAVADRLDAWERGAVVDGRPTGVSPDNVKRGISALTNHENWTAAEAMGQHVSPPNVSGQDPAVSVFETLALYPQDALDWLAGGGPAESHGREVRGFSDSRAYYWIGQRNWSADGSAASMGLWEAALSVKGGVGDTSAIYTGSAEQNTVYEKQAIVTAHVFDALSDAIPLGADFSNEADFSPEAQGTLGRNLATALPWLIEGSINEVLRYPDEPLLGEWSDVDRPTPAISITDGARVWAAAGQSPDALALQQTAVEQYTDVLSTLDSAPGKPVQWAANIERAAEVKGFHEGALGGHAELQARLSDERAQAVVDSLGFVVGNFFPGGDVPVRALWSSAQHVGTGISSGVFAASQEDVAQDNFDDMVGQKEGLQQWAYLRAQEVGHPDPAHVATEAASNYDRSRRITGLAVDDDYKHENR